MITTEDIELIDKFINEELEPLELRKFQERVRDDLDFSLEVRNQISAVKGVRAYASLQYMKDLKQQMPDIKSGGYDKYIPSIDLTKIMLRIFVPAVILGLSYIIYSIVKEDKVEPIVPTEQVPTPDTTGALSPEASDSGVNLMNLKTSDDQVADTKLNVEDPTTFKVERTGENNGIYTFKLEYDGKTQTIESSQKDLDVLLRERMEQQIKNPQ